MTPAEFTAATSRLAYHHRGAFFSELYLFVSMCLDRGVTRVVESGVLYGVSTRVFRTIWPDHVTSIELRPERVASDLIGDLVVGDGCVLVPELVTRYAGESVGVFLDGPKGGAAEKVREWCLQQPHVKVVAQHDSPKGSGELIHSYDLAFRASVGDQIDARISPEWRSHYVHGCPGMGVWVSA